MGICLFSNNNPNSIENALEDLVESYETTDLAPVKVNISVGDKAFYFQASKSQAALYQYVAELEGGLRVTPCESSDNLNQLNLLYDYMFLCTEPAKLDLSLKKNRKAEEDVLDADEYLRKKALELANATITASISITGAKVDASRVLLSEMDAALDFYRILQLKKSGFFALFTPRLLARQIAAYIDIFNGEVNGFLKKRALSKIFVKNYAIALDEPLFQPFDLSSMASVDKKMCIIDTAKVELMIESDGMINSFSLKKDSKKLDLKSISSLKSNGKRVIAIKGVRLFGRGKTSKGHLIECKTEYLFPNQDRVSSLVDAEALEFYAGDVRVRLAESRYHVEIPVSESILQSSLNCDPR